MSSSSLKAAIFGLAAITQSNAFYLPGVAPHDFYTGEPVELKVNKLRFVNNY